MRSGLIENDSESSSRGEASLGLRSSSLSDRRAANRRRLRRGRDRRGDDVGLGRQALLARLDDVGAEMVEQQEATTSTTRPPRLSVTMRRVSDDDTFDSSMRPSRHSRSRSRALRQRVGEGGVCAACVVRNSTLITKPGLRLAEAVADAVQRLDHLEVRLHDLELLAQPLDVAVDGAVVDID